MVTTTTGVVVLVEVAGKGRQVEAVVQAFDPHETSHLMEVAAEVVVVVHRTGWFAAYIQAFESVPQTRGKVGHVLVQQQPWAARVMSQGLREHLPKHQTRAVDKTYLCDMRGGETTKPQDHSQN